MLSQISPVIRITDNASQNLTTDFLSGGRAARDAGTEATLAHQFVDQNAAIFQRFGISAGVAFDGRDVAISLSSSNDIGAFPLRSPTTGSYEYGMLIRPRFEWDGLGTMLGTMGWKVIPSLQDLPVLPRSAREIPRWVMSSVIISRIENLLSCIERRFELVQADREAPKGQVNWAVYATEKLPRMQFMQVPCLFPDLRDDRLLLAAVHFVLRQQLSDLQSQRSAGVVVRTLIDKCEQLLSGVRRYPARRPTPRMLESWYSGTLKNPNLLHGIEAMEWSIENRGLAGLSSLRGMPWKMNMPEFFECWVENLAEHLCRLTGGRMRSGRKCETVTPISWESSASSSQRTRKTVYNSSQLVLLSALFKLYWTKGVARVVILINKLEEINMAKCEIKSMPGFDRITFDPGVKGGRACIRGQRATVSLILNLVANDMDVDKIIEAYPYWEREDVHQALRYSLGEDNICKFESMTEEKKGELDKRLEAHQQNPEETISGDTVLKKIRGRRGDANDD